ncbi:hypothetical protein CEK26_011992 [Fusarium fujikuroi]|nr:hypothetical protein CEK27_012009 [Fusarium fujikuroi]QGI85267.1 hypothetical protein CEK25_011996 [Fusarium fujikuroi]QGI98923.1 hypothetical protein CEK26_011992 [Fusarium fujikuroi]VTT60219.1 unnamed protein product [Fusarium fujikuroi]VTT77981.1 unnamed protein product [Fusarium fujikuroi]
MWHRVPPIAVASVLAKGIASSGVRHKVVPQILGHTLRCILYFDKRYPHGLVMLSFDLSYFQHVLTTSLSVHHRHHDSLGIDISSSRPHLVREATRDLRPEDRAYAAWGMTAHPQEKDIPSHLIFDAHHAPRHGPGHVGVTKCTPGNSEPKPYRHRGGTGDSGRTEYLPVRVGS